MQEIQQWPSQHYDAKLPCLISSRFESAIKHGLVVTHSVMMGRAMFDFSQGDERLKEPVWSRGKQDRSWFLFPFLFKGRWDSGLIRLGKYQQPLVESVIPNTHLRYNSKEKYRSR
ncbi:hypothetical protein BaRGS_00004094 [Batillaria attramentaria]|uniref:Uncharacterized protein n=1 Tax=Batillaria attramentaria TaxID=370345 RepID=A0ABD0LYT1_9CAEN